MIEREYKIGLRPCPFCGNGAPQYTHDIDGDVSGVQCTACHVIVRFPHIRTKGNREPFGVAMEKIAEAWNERAERQEK